MYLSQLFKNHEKIWVFPEDIPPEKAVQKLAALGFAVKPGAHRAVCLHRDGSVTYIHGFAQSVAFARKPEEVQRIFPNIPCVPLAHIVPEKEFAGWKERRTQK